VVVPQQQVYDVRHNNVDLYLVCKQVMLDGNVEPATTKICHAKDLASQKLGQKIAIDLARKM
jgi:hypothetical protein